LRLEKVDYVVAPYEADAQLAYLERNGFVDAVITEDSDLVIFGCRRVRILVVQDVFSHFLVIADHPFSFPLVSFPSLPLLPAFLLWLDNVQMG
jgi:exonuclease-1